ncbi:hypothetical protein N7466_008190 [Penicillium verhagenii]|uniref:uncharacterized protein n=1 Tax=Penicillium verhagenii TaxID=1562060 RepID=UPI00254518B4|nr:uncharacterized protein N7466_008190 [Penicillium verhagenii]KAJ5924003.1 hypothetical protein N7466_008190 [Penicillium verhagenii]
MLLLLCAPLLYAFLLIIYRLYFHPISKFPGPKLAAITSLYAFYFNAIKGGRYIWEIEKMHAKYGMDEADSRRKIGFKLTRENSNKGPIVRVDPHELHIADPHFYSEIYAPKQRDKDPRFTRIGGLETSMLMTIDHKLHASRRAILHNFFSKKSILGLESMVQAKVDKLAQRMSKASQTGTVICLDHAFSAATADIISEYAYPFCFDYLDGENFRNDIMQSMVGTMSLSHLMGMFPFILPLAKALPRGILRKLSPEAANVLHVQDFILEQANIALENGGKAKGSARDTIFQSLHDPSLPSNERSPIRMRDEAFALLNAGTETTASVLKIIFFNLLQNKTNLLHLRDELKDSPNASLVDLEKLPYLRGVINEGLRLSGAINRLARCSPTETLRYKDWLIPPRVMMSQSSWFVHRDPELFPNPHTFDPDRWIRAQENGERLESMLATFSKGPRQCLGMK